MRAERAGFTLIEVLIVTAVLGILGRIAVPAYQEYTYKARAAVVISEIQAVRLAAYEYHLLTNRWPADVNRGIVPPELEPYLGEGFTFQKDGYLLDWENWALVDGTPTRPQTGTVVGVSLTTSDAALGAAFVQLLGESVGRATITDHYTFVIIAAN